MEKVLSGCRAERVGQSVSAASFFVRAPPVPMAAIPTDPNVLPHCEREVQKRGRVVEAGGARRTRRLSHPLAKARKPPVADWSSRQLTCQYRKKGFVSVGTDTRSGIAERET